MEELKYSKKIEQAVTVLKRIMLKLVGKNDEGLLCQNCEESKEIQSLQKLLQQSVFEKRNRQDQHKGM